MTISQCRICDSKKFSKLFSLGNLSFTGKFSKKIYKKIPKAEINLLMCAKCKLVQLDRDFDPKYLYASDYGYRTGINKTMTLHVKDIAEQALKIIKLKKEDYVLDIASNDGTLLSFYKQKCKTVGVDPIAKNYVYFY